MSIQALRRFPYTLTAAVARSSSDDTAIRYVLPVLCMTSFWPVISQAKAAPIGRILSDSAGGSTGAISVVYDCLFIYRTSRCYDVELFDYGRPME